MCAIAFVRAMRNGKVMLGQGSSFSKALNMFTVERFKVPRSVAEELPRGRPSAGLIEVGRLESLRESVEVLFRLAISVHET